MCSLVVERSLYVWLNCCRRNVWCQWNRKRNERIWNSSSSSSSFHSFYLISRSALGLILLFVTATTATTTRVTTSAAPDIFRLENLPWKACGHVYCFLFPTRVSTLVLPVLSFISIPSRNLMRVHFHFPLTPIGFIVTAWGQTKDLSPAHKGKLFCFV